MKFKSDEIRAFTMVLQFGINMIVPILGCTIFGAWLGEKVGVNWLAIPFFVVGALAGGTNVFRLSKRFMKKKEESLKEQDATELSEETTDAKKTE